MILFLNLFFRIIPNDQIKIVSKEKHVKVVWDCTNIVGKSETFPGNPGTYTHDYFCGTNKMYIKDCTFANFRMAKKTFSNYAYLLLSKKSQLDIIHCNIYDITYHRKLISCEQESGSISVSDSTITNCKSTNPESFIFANDYKSSSFINNKIDMNNNLARVFHQKYHNGCTMINNEIRNTNYNNDNDGTSAIYIIGKATGLSFFNIQDCKFINCKGKNPAIIKINDLNYDLNIKNTVFEQCEHLNDGGYFISISSSNANPSLTFERCKFNILTSNSFNGGGIGLWFKNTDSDLHTLNFLHTQFLNIKHVAPDGGGGALQISTAATNSKTKMNINNCTFANDNTDGKGGAIYFAVDQMITIFNSSFTNCVSTIDCHAIYISKTNTETITISYCNFTDCGSKTNTFSVLLDVGYFNFLCNKISFSNKALSCGPLKATKLMNHVYRGNLFQNANNNQEYGMSCITETKIFENTYTIIIENNTFDSIDGICQGRCIFVDLGIASTISIKNNTFRNCPSGGFLIKVCFTDLESEFTIDKCNFISNIMSEYWYNSIRCNSPVWIQNQNNSPITVKFNNCYFDNNYNYKNGGAVFYGHDQHVVKAKVHFCGCKFISNCAKINGGALAITTHQGCIIDNCDFIGNKADNDCSAIYIETVNQNNANVEISIKNSRFKENGKNIEKSVISFSNSQYTPVSVLDCNFLNCKIKNNIISILSNVKSIQIKNTELKFNNSYGHGGISIQSSGKIDINSVNFISTSNNPALRIVSSGTTNEIILNTCIFDSCSSAEHICYYLSLNSNSVTIKNTIINNIESKSCNQYVGLIDMNNKQTVLNMYNVSYTNNICRSLYGGGIGTLFININKIFFQNCNFKCNEARQDKSQQRPNQPNQSPYYNGDGGAIQFGYNCKTNNAILHFELCNFENNRAQRHGGALAIQTLNNVLIDDSTFTNNVADFNFDFYSPSNLLTENHFDKKKNGKGGAIYINPIYSFEDPSNQCQSPNSYLLEISIKICNFRSNNAHDGYAIYIEGDETKTKFDFIKNDFYDNYNIENHYENNNLAFYGAVITTEIHSIKLKDIIDNENSFDYKNEKVEVPKLSYVDHYGNTKTKDFSKSSYFSKSNDFSKSVAFSESNHFSSSNQFSKTNQFSDSLQFTNSDKFNTDSNKYTNSKEFSKSDYFDATQQFTNSKEFSKSDYFDATQQFTNSKEFSKSDYIDVTQQFNDSKQFSHSNCFSKSNAFSHSNTLIFIESTDHLNDIIDSQQSSTNEIENTSTKNEVQPTTCEDINNISETIENPTKNRFTNTEVITPTSNDYSSEIKISPIATDGTSSQNKRDKKINMSLIFGIVIGAISLIGIILLILFLVIKKKSRQSSDGGDETAVEMDKEDLQIDPFSENTNDFENPLYNSNLRSQNDPFENAFIEDEI